MATVTIYTTPTCPYCHRAKALLTQKDVAFTEISMYDLDDSARTHLSQKTDGYRTVPQIFIGDNFIGGSDDLHKLDREGQLDKLLAD